MILLNPGPVNVSLVEAQSLFNRDDMNKERDLRKKVDALMVTHPGSPAKATAGTRRAFCSLTIPA